MQILVHKTRMKSLAQRITAITLSLVALSTFALFGPLAAFAQVDPVNFDQFNPLVIDESPYKEQFSTPAGVINRALQFAFPIAGLILFFMIVWGGFEMLAGAGDSKAKGAGKERATAAVVGFLLLFAVYWIAQIVQVVFGVRFL